jgi:hypothetical protein
MKSQNLDKLSQEEKDLIALLFTMQTGWTNTYMVEVKLDNVINNLLDGGNGLENHGGNGSKCYTKHWGDPEWAIIHCEDEDWLESSNDVGRALIKLSEYKLYEE